MSQPDIMFTQTEAILNSREAQRLVNLVTHSENLDAAIAAAEQAFSFLVDQLHILGDRANGYPRNSIRADVWMEGRSLTHAADSFVDAVAQWNQRRGEEQAARLAATMAMQIMAHYPEEIFPRVLRLAKCCESLGMIDEAIENFHCITGDFSQLQLEEILDSPEPFGDAETKILDSMREALNALQRLSPQDLTETQLALFERINAVLRK
jgi:hypothetical protein